MEIKVKESTVVKPSKSSPNTSIRLSNLDLVMEKSYHEHTVYFYPYNGTTNFFDSNLLKAALSRVLVLFYPLAGRLKESNDGRLEIDCNDEGVLFVDAVADGVMDGLYDFGAKPEQIGLTPDVDYSKGISTCPIFLTQVTRFKCGGVCLGTAIEHRVVDGTSCFHFCNSWSEIARGLDNVTVPPFLVRRAVLSAHNPPQPKFEHNEYKLPPLLKFPQGNNADSEAIIFKNFVLSSDQMNALREKCVQGNENVTYTTYEIVTAHAWRCVSTARRLHKDQETRLRISVEGRNRLRPPLPRGYFGNVVFHATLISSVCELQSNPLKFTVSKIHEVIAQVDDDYSRSAIDFLELQRDYSSISQALHSNHSPNLASIGWAILPIYDADFGWGRPIYLGYPRVPPEGTSLVFRTNYGDNAYGVSLPKEHMGIFEKLFFHI